MEMYLINSTGYDPAQVCAPSKEEALQHYFSLLFSPNDYVSIKEICIKFNKGTLEISNFDGLDKDLFWSYIREYQINPSANTCGNTFIKSLFNKWMIFRDLPPDYERIDYFLSKMKDSILNSIEQIESQIESQREFQINDTWTD